MIKLKIIMQNIMISLTLTFFLRKFFIVRMILNNDTKNMMTVIPNTSGIIRKKQNTIKLKNIKKTARISFKQDFSGRNLLRLKIIPTSDIKNITGEPNSKRTITALSQNLGDHFS